MKIVKPFVHILGFFPAIFYSAITIVFLIIGSPIVTMIGAILISICMFIAPIFLYRDKQTWVGVIAVIAIAGALFIEASFPQAFSPQFSFTLGIVAIVFYSIYYYVMRKC